MRSEHEKYSAEGACDFATKAKSWVEQVRIRIGGWINDAIGYDAKEAQCS